MINRSKLMTSAWAAYRLVRPAVYAAGDTAIQRMFLPKLFGRLLRSAWDDARMAELTAGQFVAAQSRVMADKAAALSPAERSTRISAIRDEIAVLDYAPLGVRHGHRRADLTAQLDALTAA
jgi:hypothetical protein